METFHRPFRTASGSGLAAVVVYVLATILGGALHPGYSHVRDAISELTASQAVHRVPLAVLYVVYNLFLVGFAGGLLHARPASRLLWSAFVLVASSSASGIAQVTAFPQDSTGSPGTARGALHIVLAGLTALLCVVTALIYGVAFRRLGLPGSAWVPAFAAAGYLLIAGPVAAASVGGPLMGLLERFTIGGYLAWVAITSLVLRRLPLREAAGLRRGPGSAPPRGARRVPAGVPPVR